MPSEFALLLGTAASLGFVHTLLGPDHYVPFIAMAKARGWSNRRALGITLLAGLGHVVGSVVLGLAGLVFGMEVLKLTAVEAVRGDVAGWLLFSFGLAYMLWGIRRALRKRVLQHDANAPHSHDGEPEHVHRHGLHTHIHPERTTITPWILFTILVFGPCEPLIPVLMYPAARVDAFTVFAVAATFSLFTIGTMSAMVYAGLRGLAFLPLRAFERYAHALAGLVVAICGAGVQFLGF